jgi:hypothetical protein
LSICFGEFISPVSHFGKISQYETAARVVQLSRHLPENPGMRQSKSGAASVAQRRRPGFSHGAISREILAFRSLSLLTGAANAFFS